MTDGWMTDNGSTSEARAYEKPTLTILGVFRGAKLVRAEWTGNVIQLSDKTITACQALGMDIVDDPSNYIFHSQVF